MHAWCPAMDWRSIPGCYCLMPSVPRMGSGSTVNKSSVFYSYQQIKCVLAKKPLKITKGFTKNNVAILGECMFYSMCSPSCSLLVVMGCMIWTSKYWALGLHFGTHLHPGCTHARTCGLHTGKPTGQTAA